MSDSDGFPACEPRGGLPAPQPARSPTAGHLVGRVESSTTRVESRGRDFGSETMLTFRLLEPDGQGPRGVQLRGRSISGTVHDGDWVEGCTALVEHEDGRMEILHWADEIARREAPVEVVADLAEARVAA